jgi:hypothetical protein
MKVHTLDIDSGDRDPILYPNPGDYVIDLKNPVYDVSKISLVSARIHNSQLLIHERNNTFTINTASTSETISLANGNYSGITLANEVVNKSTIVTGSSYDTYINEITFTAASDFTFAFYGGVNGYTTSNAYTTPHDVLGLPSNNVHSSNNTLKTGSINLQGVDAFVLKLSSGSDEFNKTVYSETPFYTGRILVCGDVINYSGTEDAVEHNFDSGTQKTISSIRVQFFYSSNGRLIPYDFRNANHVIKLALTCSTDKLENVPKVKRDFSLPPPVYIPEFEDVHRWDAFVSIFLIVFVGVVLLLVTKKKT